MLKYQVFFKDSRNLNSFIPDSSVDLVISGPPYWNEVVYSNQASQLSAISDYQSFLAEMAKVTQGCAKSLKSGGVMGIWLHDFYRNTGQGQSYIPFHADFIKLAPAGVVFRNIIIWDRYLNRDKGSFPADGAVGTRFMYILIFQKEGVHATNQKIITRSLEKSFWEPVWHKKTSPKLLNSTFLFRAAFNIGKPFSKYLKSLKQKINSSAIIHDSHSFVVYKTECPEEVVERLITDYTQEGDVVLDPFLGSGTVMKVSAQLNRNCIGVEINPQALGAITKKMGNQDFEIIK